MIFHFSETHTGIKLSWWQLFTDTRWLWHFSIESFGSLVPDWWITTILGDSLASLGDILQSVDFCLLRYRKVSGCDVWWAARNCHFQLWHLLPSPVLMRVACCCFLWWHPGGRTLRGRQLSWSLIMAGLYGTRPVCLFSLLLICLIFNFCCWQLHPYHRSLQYWCHWTSK